MNRSDPPDNNLIGERVHGRAWMLPLLDLLFEDYSQTAAIRLLRDDLAREATAPLLAEALADRGVSGFDLESPVGDNLLQGLLAVRAKFTWEEAREKVALNITMTGGER